MVGTQAVMGYGNLLVVGRTKVPGLKVSWYFLGGKAPISTLGSK